MKFFVISRSSVVTMMADGDDIVAKKPMVEPFTTDAAVGSGRHVMAGEVV